VKIWKIADGEYIYHGTGEGSFRKIRENGLIPQNGQSIYFSDSEQYARTYAQRKGNSYGDRIMRIRKTDDIVPDSSIMYKGDFKANRVIHPEEIEVKINNLWIPIQDYVDEEIGIMSIKNIGIE